MHIEYPIGRDVHLDVYLNLECNLRCRHCFVGERLGAGHVMPFSMYGSVITYARSKGVESLALLGGEPSIYPRFTEAVRMGFDVGFREVRIITNGTEPLRRFLASEKRLGPLIVFSIDGASAEAHEFVRGPRTFGVLQECIKLAQARGFRCAGITSIGPWNIQEIEPIVAMANSYQFEYLNMHLVSGVGFARREKKVSPRDWSKVRERVIACTKGLKVPVRFERRFVASDEFDVIPEIGRECVVRTGRGGNVMVMPDGGIYRCALFFDGEMMCGGLWKNNAMLTSLNQQNETTFCLQSSAKGCPGKAYLDDEVDSTEVGYVSVCMYKKEVIVDGIVSLER